MATAIRQAPITNKRTSAKKKPARSQIQNYAILASPLRRHRHAFTPLLILDQGLLHGLIAIFVVGLPSRCRAFGFGRLFRFFGLMFLLRRRLWRRRLSFRPMTPRLGKEFRRKSLKWHLRPSRRAEKLISSRAISYTTCLFSLGLFSSLTANTSTLKIGFPYDKGGSE